MAEEFKACLISLGYDVENDKQVGAPVTGSRDGSDWRSQQKSRTNPLDLILLFSNLDSIFSNQF